MTAEATALLKTLRGAAKQRALAQSLLLSRSSMQGLGPRQSGHGSSNNPQSPISSSSAVVQRRKATQQLLMEALDSSSFQSLGAGDLDTGDEEEQIPSSGSGASKPLSPLGGAKDGHEGARSGLQGRNEQRCEDRRDSRHPRNEPSQAGNVEPGDEQWVEARNGGQGGHAESGQLSTWGSCLSVVGGDEGSCARQQQYGLHANASLRWDGTPASSMAAGAGERGRQQREMPWGREGHSSEMLGEERRQGSTSRGNTARVGEDGSQLVESIASALDAEGSASGRPLGPSGLRQGAEREQRLESYAERCGYGAVIQQGGGAAVSRSGVELGQVIHAPYHGLAAAAVAGAIPRYVPSTSGISTLSASRLGKEDSLSRAATSEFELEALSAEVELLREQAEREREQLLALRALREEEAQLAVAVSVRQRELAALEQQIKVRVGPEQTVEFGTPVGGR